MMAHVALAKCVCQPVATAGNARRKFSAPNRARQRRAFGHMLQIKLRLSQKFGLDFSIAETYVTDFLTVARIGVDSHAMLNKNSQRIAPSRLTWLRIARVQRRHFLNLVSNHAAAVPILCPAAASRVEKSLHVVIFATRYVTLETVLLA